MGAGTENTFYKGQNFETEQGRAFSRLRATSSRLSTWVRLALKITDQGDTPPDLTQVRVRFPRRSEDIMFPF